MSGPENRFAISECPSRHVLGEVRVLTDRKGPAIRRVLPELNELLDALSVQSFLQSVVDGSPSASPERSLVLFKMLVLRNGLELDSQQLVDEVGDRNSLRRFCGLSGEQSVPEARELKSFEQRIADGPAATLLGLVGMGWRGIRSAAGDRRDRPLLSIVSPVFRAEEIVDELVRRITGEVSKLTSDFEIVLVDDGSPDGSWQRIEQQCARSEHVRGLKLSRNFGQHYAITAGLDHAWGRWVVVMDCDLQDDPKYIADLYRKALEGYDIVYTVKESRAHNPIKNALAHAFFAVFNWLASGRVANPRVGSFSLLSQRAVSAYKEIGDVHRHYLFLLQWLGFPSAEVPIRHHRRYAGRSSYGFLALVRHAINGITSGSDRLLYLASGVGIMFFGVFIVAAIYIVTTYFLYGFKEGWTSTIVLTLLSTSIILLAIGIVGIYIGKIFEQAKRRPLYLVEERLNL